MNTVMELWGFQKTSNWCLFSSAMLWGVGYSFVTDVSLQNIGSDVFFIFRNVAKQLPIYNVQLPRRTKALTAPQEKPQISHETCKILSKWTIIGCPWRIKGHVVNQQRKERHGTYRTTPVSLDGGCSEIIFQTFHFQVHIFRCQKICTAYRNVPTFQGEENVRVHLCKKGAVVCWKREVSYMEHCRWCKSRLRCR
jgi:hypothetical protein